MLLGFVFFTIKTDRQTDSIRQRTAQTKMAAVDLPLHFFPPLLVLFQQLEIFFFEFLFFLLHHSFPLLFFLFFEFSNQSSKIDRLTMWHGFLDSTEFLESMSRISSLRRSMTEKDVESFNSSPKASHPSILPSHSRHCHHQNGIVMQHRRRERCRQSSRKE